ncbi:MAG TPA: hypothetical protein PLG77_08090 [Burkholderiaceae bacterium]|nr:hypothetical protein [Burkholderiaceae bacterium]
MSNGGRPGGLPPAWRVPLLILGFIALFTGVGAGLARLAWPMPLIVAAAAPLHGLLMVSGFFGVVISLERAVAIGRLWAYAGPLAAGLATGAALHDAIDAAAMLYVAASVVLFAASADIVRRQRALFTLTIAAGAAAWLAGNLLWAFGAPMPVIAPWWLAFLIVTIAGERLELSRFMPPSKAAQRLFGGVLAAMLAGLVASAYAWGAQLFGASLVALAAWLFRHDIARRTVRQKGLTRFIAVCLLSGYVWLAVGGAVMLFAGGLAQGSASYDAALHALTLGFVFAMVFGHAPIIFPAVLRVAVPYHPLFYAPLGLLHAGLALRIVGDAADGFEATRWGAMLSALALLAFILNTIAAVVRGQLAARRSPP